MDLGIRYTNDVIATKFLVGSYPVIRWQDRQVDLPHADPL